MWRSIKLGAPIGLWILLITPALTKAVPTGLYPYGVAVNPLTNRIYVVNDAGDSVTVIDGRRDTAIATIPVGDGPYDADVNPTTNRVYVSNKGGSNSVSVIDGNTNEVIATIPIGPIPHGIGINPKTNRIYVGNQEESSVFVIDGETNAILNIISLGDESDARGVALNAATNRIYVANVGSESVSVIDGNTDTVIATVSVPLHPMEVAVNQTTNRIYATGGSAAAVSVIDGSTNSVIATIPVQSGPDGVGVAETSNHIYVANSASHSVSTIDGMTNAVISNKSVGENPRAVGVNDVTHRIYVSNNVNSNVSVLVEGEHLRNPSFDGDSNGDGLPNAWKGVNLAPSDRLDPDRLDVYDGRFSWAMRGVRGVRKELRQRIQASGPTGTLVRLEGFSKSEDTAPTGGAYKTLVDILYTDETSSSFSIRWPKDTHGWRRRAASFRAAKDYKQLTTHIVYDNQTGTVWFDALHLWPSP